MHYEDNEEKSLNLSFCMCSTMTPQRRLTLRFQKYPDMCGLGLRRLPLEIALMHVYVRRAHFTTKSRTEIVML